MIERKILIGLITNTEYLRRLQGEWKQEYLESPTARLIAGWCWEYFKRYKRAPMRDIELVYIRKLKKGIDKALAEEIEGEILPGLSEEYEREGEVIDGLLDDTRQYFIERQIAIHKEVLDVLLEKGEIEEAETLVERFRLKRFEEDESLDLSDPKSLEKISPAFNETRENLIKFPGALGHFINDQLVRGGFVAFQSPQKRGKTFTLLELGMRGAKQGRNVAFFQAGDMTENQLMMRVCVYLAMRSNKKKYCGRRYVPVVDCVKNQADTCENPMREVEVGVFAMGEEQVRKEVTRQALIKAGRENPDYRPCRNCPEFKKSRWGTVWLEKRNIGKPLTEEEAKNKVEQFFVKSGRNMRISTHANGTLTLSKVDGILDKWERNGFVPDIIIFDYVDIMEAEKEKEFRHKENEKWKGLRRLSEERNCLVVTATQSDADSLEKDRVRLRNFSENVRKYDHVTAMYGLGQDASGREKQMGLMALTKLVVREDEFVVGEEVMILQDLGIGRPFLGSFY